MSKLKDIDLVTMATMLNPTLSTEGALESIPAFFRDRIKQVIEAITSTRKSDLFDIDTKQVYTKELHKAYSKYRIALPNIDYGVVKYRLTPKAIGLKGDLLELSKGSKAIMTDVRPGLLDLLRATNNAISKLVIDDKWRMSSRPVLINKSHAKFVKGLQDSLNTVIDVKSITDHAKVLELAPNLPVIDLSANMLLELNTGRVTDYWTEVDGEVDRLDSYGKALLDTLGERGIKYRKERVVELAEYLSTAGTAISLAASGLEVNVKTIIQTTELMKVVTRA